MRILITGASGFIGSELLLELSKLDHQIVALARNDTQLILNKNITISKFSNLSTINFETITKNIDIVIHLLWTSLPRDSIKHASIDINQNLILGLNLLNACVKNNVTKVIFSSSGGTVYGTGYSKKIPETAACSPVNSYGVCKLAFEQYLSMYQYHYGLNYVALRISATYGERQKTSKKQGVITTWLNNINQGKPIEIWGKGDIVRDYIYIKDVVRSLVLSLHPEKNGIYNIGYGKGVSLVQLSDIIQEITKKDISIIFKESNKSDANSIVLDIAKSKEELGWEALYSLEEGIKATYQFIVNS